MSRIPAKVREILEARGLRALEFEPGSTPTVATAAARLGVEPGRIAKSLLFRSAGGAYHLVVCAGDGRVSSSKLKTLVGSKPSMADAAETLEATGFPPGGVCPWGLKDVAVWIDESLRRWSTVYPAAGTDGSAVETDYRSLLETTGGRPCSVIREVIRD